jgi:XTP/dITP diphosphohydrolase
MKEIILATSNPGKLAEFQAILSPIHCISQSSLDIGSVEETGLSFIENALLKARHASRIANLPALADDSGLVVPALQGEPGIFSARFAGVGASDQQNIQHLLEKLIDREAREAYFYCALALVRDANDPTPFLATGKLWGKINLQPQGSHGFGYDPVFYLPQYGCTVAELSATIKNNISHRALALHQLRGQLDIAK